MQIEKNEILAVADQIRPNGLDLTLKERWLREIEAIVRVEIRGADLYEVFDEEDDSLVVPVPYDRLYVWYLCAIIDLAQGDLQLYELDMALYNAAFQDYAKWFLRAGTQ
jgi:hypothetical protein